MFKQQEVVGDGLEAVEVAGVHHQEARARQVDHPEEVAPVGEVDQALHPAGLLDPEPHGEVLLAVGQERRDRLPGCRPRAISAFATRLAPALTSPYRRHGPPPTLR